MMDAEKLAGIQTEIHWIRDGLDVACRHLNSLGVLLAETLPEPEPEKRYVVVDLARVARGAENLYVDRYMRVGTVEHQPRANSASYRDRKAADDVAEEAYCVFGWHCGVRELEGEGQEEIG